jgi:hypothetical protein
LRSRDESLGGTGKPEQAGLHDHEPQPGGISTSAQDFFSDRRRSLLDPVRDILALSSTDYIGGAAVSFRQEEATATIESTAPAVPSRIGRPARAVRKRKHLRHGWAKPNHDAHPVNATTRSATVLLTVSAGGEPATGDD